MTSSGAQDLDALMTLRPGRSRAVSSTDPSFTGNADRIESIAPGETHQVLLDGRPVPLTDDGSSPAVPPVIDLHGRDLVVKDVYLDSFRLSPGRHALRFEAARRHPLSRGDALGLDSVRLRQRWDRERKLLR